MFLCCIHALGRRHFDCRGMKHRPHGRSLGSDARDLLGPYSKDQQSHAVFELLAMLAS